MTEERIEPVARVVGDVVVPGDKSISHRALLLGALARGRTYVGNLSPAADVASTARCLAALGAVLRPFGDGRVVVEGGGLGHGLRTPGHPLDCGNSGTTMRLLAGVCAAHPLDAVLDGDASLRRRPMERVAEPLRAMGAEVETTCGRAPLRIRGRERLRGGEHRLPVASAQVKSAVLLAGLAADSPTTVVEPATSRDHTERLLRRCGIAVDVCGARVTVVPGEPEPFGLAVPGDLSSAAFFLALAAARPGWWVRCREVTLNPGRTGILEVLEAMGAEVEIEERPPAADVEPVGDVTVRGGRLRGTRIAGDLIPRCLDELPVLAVLATQAEGETVVADAGELRVKESDRIAVLVAGLRTFGARVEELDDGFVVLGPTPLHAARVDSGGDHRLAMAWMVAGCLSEGGSTVVTGTESIAISYPGFVSDLRTLARS